MSSLHVVIKRLLKCVAVLGGKTHFYISVHYIIFTLFFLFFQWNPAFELAGNQA